MSTLVDPSVVTRCAQPTHPLCQPAADALILLRQQGEQLCLVPQNFYEFWVVATQSTAQNGLGLTPLRPRPSLLASKRSSPFGTTRRPSSSKRDWNRKAKRGSASCTSI